MIALVNLDIVLIGFGVWLLLAALFGLGFGQIFRNASRNEPDYERLSLIEQDAAERRLRTERAMARHDIAKAERARMERAA